MNNDPLNNAESLPACGSDSLNVSIGDEATLRANDAEGLGRIDRYVLKEKLGQGSLGVVCRALDEEAAVKVSLKALPALVSHSAEELEHIRRNFALVSQLVHSNIANVKYLHRVEFADAVAKTALCVEEGDYLLVMEYVPGFTLSAWRCLFSNQQVPVEQAVAVCRQIATALDYAHTQNIIHRDLKPSNVMVGEISNNEQRMSTTEESANPKLQTSNCIVKVLDFDLAAEIRSSMSRVSCEPVDTTGLRPYMAPEQWIGRKLSAAIDQYALAVIFYELVSGAIPFASVFDAGDLADILDGVQNQAPKPLKALSKRQNAALLRALAKNPDDRFESCGAFVGALENACRSASRRNHKPPKKYKIRGRWIAVGVAIAALIFGGLFGWQGNAAKDAPQDSPAAQVDQVLVEETVALQAEADVKLSMIRNYAAEWSGYAPELERIESELVSGDSLLEAGEYSLAAERFNAVLGNVAAVRDLEAMRQASLAARAEALAALQHAETLAVVAPSLAIWRAGEDAFAQAEKMHEVGEFGEALTHWQQAEQTFDAYAGFASGVAAVEAARAEYEAALAQSDVDFERYGGEPWRSVKHAVELAEMFAVSEAWDESVKGYEAARLGLYAAEIEAKSAWEIDQIKEHLTTAREAQSEEQWDVALSAAVSALALAPDHKEANEIRTDAQRNLMPQLKVICNVSDVEVIVLESGEDGSEMAPSAEVATYRLEKDKTYTLTISRPGYTSHSQELAADWTGLRELSIDLEAYFAPEKDKVWAVDLGSGVEMDFVPIPAGSFWMGSESGDLTERPRHKVTLTQSFWLAKTEVTQAQWKRVMNRNPSYFKGNDLPVERVSWTDAVEFCRKLTEQEIKAGRLPEGWEYALPTEAQWEYACRPGRQRGNARWLNAGAWHKSNSEGETHPVASRLPNAWGLYDMQGNVWEWCSDRFGDYSTDDEINPVGADRGVSRVLRGGSWYFDESYSSPTSRYSYGPSYKFDYLGFRPLVQQRSSKAE